jgi:cytidine deaminase
MASSPAPLADEQKSTLRAAALAVAEHSYSPYSRFQVGAALLLSNGVIVTGTNVENASYRLTCCAEQSAIARAVAEHGPEIRLRAVAIANLNHSASPPCGACRQTLAEFGAEGTVILYPAEGGVLAEMTLGQLLPAAFRDDFTR